jgi:hypothetical protein
LSTREERRDGAKEKVTLAVTETSVKDEGEDCTKGKKEGGAVGEKITELH